MRAKATLYPSIMGWSNRQRCLLASLVGASRPLPFIGSWRGSSPGNLASAGANSVKRTKYHIFATSRLRHKTGANVLEE